MCAELYAQIVFVDIQTSNVLKVLTKKDLRIGFNQFSCYISEILDDRIIITTNKGKVRILGQLQKVIQNYFNYIFLKYIYSKIFFTLLYY